MVLILTLSVLMSDVLVAPEYAVIAVAVVAWWLELWPCKSDATAFVV